jgi:hypothetical protein
VAPLLLNRVDDVVGETIERVMRAHHVRPLARRGAEERLERRGRDGWADGKLTLLQHVSRRTEALLGPLNGLVVDG